MIKKKFPYFLNVAMQLFPDKEEIINFFKNNTKESESTIRTVFNCKDDVNSYIKNYTAESFYYRYLNQFLRQGDFDAFRKLSSHISKFIYLLYEYRKKNIKVHEKTELFRKMYISLDEFNNYESSKGKVICFPSFTSTTIIDGSFTPTKKNPSDLLVQLIIKQNETKSVVSISEHSVFESEKEYLFLPFSFFKITNVKIGSGNYYNPHIIYLKAMYSDSSIEDLFIYFFEKYTDNLDPEGIDTFFISEDGQKICLNAIKGADLKAECVIFEKKGNTIKWTFLEEPGYK